MYIELIGEELCMFVLYQECIALLTTISKLQTRSCFSIIVNNMHFFCKRFPYVLGHFFVHLYNFKQTKYHILNEIMQECKR